ncbi:MAG: hypothetical protein JO250_00485 [Armatimonadetes bacterium]|nr:hypothetical protein [Armatimonadota bacterium]
MKVTKLLTLLAVGATGALLYRRYAESTAPLPGASPVAPVVEDVLKKHQGEDSPMVHAFEEALEEERRYEEQLAHDAGVRA